MSENISRKWIKTKTDIITLMNVKPTYRRMKDKYTKLDGEFSYTALHWKAASIWIAV
jgi:hypothetical protein